MDDKASSFGTHLAALRAAGVRTRSARGFWGGVTEKGEIVVTIWEGVRDRDGRYMIWKPPTNHGGLKAAWEQGRVHPGVEVRAILLRAKEVLPIGQRRSIRGAALLPTRWQVAELVTGENWDALIEPLDS